MEKQELEIRVRIACEVVETDKWREIYEREAIRCYELTNRNLAHESRSLYEKGDPFHEGLRMIIAGEIIERLPEKSKRELKSWGDARSVVVEQ